MKKTVSKKTLLYVISFALVAVGAYLVAVAYFAQAPVIDDAPPSDYNALTPEEQQALLDKFKNQTNTQPSGGSSAISDSEADAFMNQQATNDSALTPTERQKFLEQGQ